MRSILKSDVIDFEVGCGRFRSLTGRPRAGGVGPVETATKAVAAGGARCNSRLDIGAPTTPLFAKGDP
jgi:hypothetical protein